MKPTGAQVGTGEGAHIGVLQGFVEGDDVEDDPHMHNTVMHVRTRALRSSVRQLQPTVDRAYVAVDHSKYPLRTEPEGATDSTSVGRGLVAS